MDSIHSVLYNIYNRFTSYNTDELFIYSINTQINKINLKISELDSLIIKKKDEVSLYEKNFNENELEYNQSKQNVTTYNENINKKLDCFKENLNKVFDTNSKIYDKILLLNNNFNEFKNINNTNIFDKYSELNSDIEKNVLKCEISKEKLNSVKNELTLLQNDKKVFSNKMDQLIELNKSVEVI